MKIRHCLHRTERRRDPGGGEDFGCVLRGEGAECGGGNKRDGGLKTRNGFLWSFGRHVHHLCRFDSLDEIRQNVQPEALDPAWGVDYHWWFLLFSGMSLGLVGRKEVHDALDEVLWVEGGGYCGDGVGADHRGDWFEGWVAEGGLEVGGGEFDEGDHAGGAEFGLPWVDV